MHYRIDRRAMLAILGGGLVAACSNPVGPMTTVSAPGPSWPTAPNPAFDAWVDGFRARAIAKGISPATVASAFRGVGFLPGVVERDRNQTEFTRTLEDYLAIAASEERITKGRAALARHGGTLSAIEARYGVPANVVVAVWGLESFYGERRGNAPIISSLATLAFDGRRGAFFEGQLIAALQILENGDVTPAGMTGSWAGAMGHTQFIPTSYLAYAVDFNGDGRRDIWSDDPTDALASTAAYLSRSGWERGRPWGGELGSSAANSGTPVSVIQPQPGGPQFAVFRNFSVIKRYNNSDLYALGVGHLSDRLAGGGPLRAKFGPDARGMTLDDRKALQQRLTARGFDTGGSDGVIGPKTISAIRDYQRRNGLAETGEPSMELLRRLG
ncbi:lytic murein transglycosylase [Seohaeicola zhoushanensis]|uniref:Murein transglycosylase n=1 Tax=Seohaeicola zhoushanensis TaxID=1569283 RepID=A0A8J3GUQ6_9RHOB|nr:lytic murein transglycosylase [Seohaeicola zhoushanensis]GHF40700.1 murein transglycosylase [Seohaeicola zhoushanensis]